MTWRRRLIELACAGGTLALQPGCPAIIGCGNANPDPCVCDRTPDPDHAPQCIAEKKCTEDGYYWNFYDGSPLPTTDAGTQLWGHCEGPPQDAGVDASTVLPDAVPPD